jgi:polyphosphate kinase
MTTRNDSSPDPKDTPIRIRKVAGASAQEPARRVSPILEFSPSEVRTPADPVAVPSAGKNGAHDLGRPEYYLNRELTWLNFTFRVLRMAEDARTPLLERVKFLSIVGSNLDEFFMKRIGGLKQQVGAGIQDLTVDGRTPQQQIDESLELIRELNDRKLQALLGLQPELERHGIRVVEWEDLRRGDREYLRKKYLENYYPLITPQATDPAHPFPFISNLSLNLLVRLRHPNDPVVNLARVKVPVGVGVPRFLKLEGPNTFVPLESVMAGNLDLLFPEMVIESVARFRVTRNANTERDEEKADDLLALIESELRDRRLAPVVRLEVSPGLSGPLRAMLASEFGLDERGDVYEAEGMLGMRDLMELVDLPFTALRYPALHPIDHPQLSSDPNIFNVIREAGYVLLHHPYVSFKTSVERFLREASLDPEVLAIKMTLYRTSSDTKAIEYLIDAAQNGKQVAVVVELKARFDEQANIRWASRLEEAGIHVTYGVVGLKTHCKAILVVRHENDNIRRYAHIGTGNYHAGTARLYTDLGLLTSDPEIGADLTELFNYLTTGYKPRRDYQKLLPSPKICRAALLEKIEREISKHSSKSPGLIQFKMNALEDPGITSALYRASQAGVHVDLIVRDTCRLRPGVPGLSENVRVVSIVGRFLEHARITYFKNGGDEEYTIGSADLMRRNLNSRVEIMAPIEDPGLQQELRRTLDLQLADRRDAWEMQPDGSYVQLSSKRESKGSQERHVEIYAKQLKKVTRLKRRKPRGLNRRSQ